MNRKELARLMQSGLATPQVYESSDCFLEDLHGKFQVCALGAALVGKFQNPFVARQALEEAKELSLRVSGGEADYVNLAADLLEINYDVADYLDKAHMLGIPIAELATSLTENPFRA